MRLSQDQILSIVTAIKNAMASFDCEIYLFGSRLRDDLQGGDIDLLVLSTPDGCRHLQEKKYEILVNMKKAPAIGDRKIDLLIATPNQMATEPFLKLINDDKIRLD